MRSGKADPVVRCERGQSGRDQQDSDAQLQINMIL
jgi:hypothetical protein